MIKPFTTRLAALSLLALMALLALSGCATAPSEPSIRLGVVARDAAPASPRWQPVEPEAAGLRVWRKLAPVPPTRGMPLQPGDVVQTAPGTAAVIAFTSGAGSATITVDESTRVRVGSLEVFFGRIFANVRGLFETTSENLVAGVEGTRYLFDVRADRSVHVAVVDGVVTCRPTTSGWAPIPLRAGQQLELPGSPAAPPRVGAADPRALRDAAAWAAAVARAGQPETPATPYPDVPFNIRIGPLPGAGQPGGDGKPSPDTQRPHSR